MSSAPSAVLAIALFAALPAAASERCPLLLDHCFPVLRDQEPQSLFQWQGRVLVVIGFPAIDFGGQAPGSNQQIAGFCRNSYCVRFPMFSNTSVVGDAALLASSDAYLGE